MAVATTVATKVEPEVSEAQMRLRQAVSDVNKQLRQPSKAGLNQALADLEIRWVSVTQELTQLGKPLTVRAPRVTGQEPEPSPERIAQLQAIDQVCTLLESARAARSQALLALSRLG